jgi:cysteine desulfurase
MDVVETATDAAGAQLVYLDNAATTPLLPCVQAAMVEALACTFGNPANSSHELGRCATQALDEARAQVAGLVGAEASSICFTSGATEANNLAIRGLARHAEGSGRRVIVVSAIEHRSILAPAEELAERAGFEVRRAPVDANGVLDPEAFEALLDDDVLLACVHLANNEIGTLQPIEQVVRLAHARGALVLCDATQAIGKVSVDCSQLDVDLLSLSAHKFHGPKGAGALVVAPRVPIAPQLTGGGQEGGMRAGTPNVPAIIGMGVAAREARRHLECGAAAEVAARRDRIERELLAMCPSARANGAGAPRVGGISSITFRGLCGADLVHRTTDVAISRGSACSTGATCPSHVLTALGHDEADAFSTLRISLGATTSDEDVDRAVAAFARTLLEDVA